MVRAAVVAFGRRWSVWVRYFWVSVFWQAGTGIATYQRLHAGCCGVILRWRYSRFLAEPGDLCDCGRPRRFSLVRVPLVYLTSSDVGTLVDARIPVVL